MVVSPEAFMSSRIAVAIALAALLPGTVRAEAFQPTPTDGLVWVWEPGATRTWLIENEVMLASYLWVMADQNKEARLVAFHTRMVMTCHDTGEGTRKVSALECRIDDFAISGAGMEGDRGLLQPILEEMDGKVTGAVLQVGMRHDGRLVGVDLEEIQAANRRESRMIEAIRIVFARALAGFDLQLPPGGVSAEGVWGQYQNQLFGAPSDRGSQGAGEVAHLVREIDQGWAIIDSAGKGMVVPGNDSGAARDYFASRLDSVSVFDLDEKILRERVWTVLGKPTASSAIAEGGAGVNYLQMGKILFLPEGVARPDLGPTLEVVPPEGQAQSAIRNWSPAASGPPR